jgi:hypothetical protein
MRENGRITKNQGVSHMSKTFHFRSLLLPLLGLLVVGCGPTFQTTAPPPQKREEVFRQGNFVYGPRWSDYRAWGRLELGITKQGIIDLLGEPYLPESGAQQPGGNMELLIFKIRTKLYKISEIKYITTAGVTGISATQTVPAKDIYPEMSADTGFWGDITDLYCYFQNGKLVKWERTITHEEEVQKPVKGASTESSSKK